MKTSFKKKKLCQLLAESLLILFLITSTTYADDIDISFDDEIKQLSGNNHSNANNEDSIEPQDFEYDFQRVKREQKIIDQNNYDAEADKIRKQCSINLNNDINDACEYKEYHPPKLYLTVQHPTDYRGPCYGYTDDALDACLESVKLVNKESRLRREAKKEREHRERENIRIQRCKKKWHYCDNNRTAISQGKIPVTTYPSWSRTVEQTFSILEKELDDFITADLTKADSLQAQQHEKIRTEELIIKSSMHTKNSPTNSRNNEHELWCASTNYDSCACKHYVPDDKRTTCGK